MGHSGSPILMKNKNGNQSVIGIHTHSGIEDNINSGLFFTRKMLKKVTNYVK